MMSQENELQKAASKILKKCMGLAKNNSCLIIFDENKKRIADALFKAALISSEKSKLLQIPIGKQHGEEPPKYAAKEMLNYDVIMLVTTKSLSHTKARSDATKKGARIASMPGINEDMFLRAASVDYSNISERSKKLIYFLKNKKIIKIKTRLGTNIDLSIKGRKLHGNAAGLYVKKGSWGNIPAGEIFLAPNEGTTNGIFIVDASILGKVDKPIKITVNNGFAAKIEGGKTALKLKKELEKIKNKNAYNIAELGIGMNDNAKIIGNVLEDEKVLGTAHIAMGNNASFGGKVNVPIHLDGVFKKPTMEADGKVFMKNGKLLI